MAVVNKTLRDVVFQAIRSKNLRPTELIRSLSDEAYPRELENELSDLIESGEVVFGPDGILRATKHGRVFARI